MRMMETGELRQMMETIVPKLVTDGGTLSVEDVSFDDDGGVTYNNEYVKLKDFSKTSQAPLVVTRRDEPSKYVGDRTELSVNVARREGPSIGGARRVEQSKDSSETVTQKENQSNLVAERRDRSRAGVQRSELLTTRFNTPSLTVLLSQPDDTTVVKNDVPLRLHTRINRRVTSLRFFRCCAANSSDEETTANPELGSNLEVETGMDSNSRITAGRYSISFYKFCEFVGEEQMFRLLDAGHPTASGTDGLPHWYLRVAAPFISVPLAHPFNLSFSSSHVPPQWRFGPLHHACTRFPRLHHGPIPDSPVTPTLSRILEKVAVGPSSTLCWSTRTHNIYLWINLPSGPRDPPLLLSYAFFIVSLICYWQTLLYCCTSAW